MQDQAKLHLGVDLLSKILCENKEVLLLLLDVNASQSEISM